MIVWNLNKFVDIILVTHSEEELKELFAGQLSRRKMLLRYIEAKKELEKAGK